MSTDDPSRSSRLDIHILNLLKIRVELGRLREGSTGEEAPTELNTTNCPPFSLAVSRDKLFVRCTKSVHGVIEANRSAPEKPFLYYFEMYVKNGGEKGQIGIGFTQKGVNVIGQPPGKRLGYVYHGDDGRLYCGPTHTYPFGPTFTTGDIVGAGINHGHNEVFFTKNRVLVGHRISHIKGPSFPTIALHSRNEQVYVNFGQKEFAFDVKKYEAEMKRDLDGLPKNGGLDFLLSFEPPSPSTTHRIIHSYFLHSGFEETLKAFALDCKYAVPHVGMSPEDRFIEQDLAYDLKERNTIRQLVSGFTLGDTILSMKLIRKGEIDASLSIIKDLYPQILEDEYSAASFLFHCQKFIEFLRAQKLHEAIMYANQKLNKFHLLSRFRFLTKDCFDLLGYIKPLESGVGHLIKDDWQEIMADAINVVILDTNPEPRDQRGGSYLTYLETLLLHLQFCVHEVKKLNIASYMVDSLSEWMISVIHDDAHIYGIVE